LTFSAAALAISRDVEEKNSMALIVIAAITKDVNRRGGIVQETKE
jgi:hypothetical protein